MADQYQLPPNEPSIPVDNVPPPRPPKRSPGDKRWLPLLLIGGGVLLFLGNSGAFASLAWSVLVPLGMLAVGLDLITQGRSRRRIAIGALVAAPLLVLIVGGAKMIPPTPETVPSGEMNYENISLDGLERIRVDIKQSARNIGIGALDDQSGDLFEVDGPQPDFRREGNTGVIVMHGSEWHDGNTQLRLSPRLPIDMNVEVNGGNAEPIDLRELRIENLNLQVRAGNTELQLPSQGVMNVEVNSTAGNVEIDVPDELNARIDASASFGNIDIDNDSFEQRDNLWFSSDYSEDAANRATLKLSARAGNIEVE